MTRTQGQKKATISTVTLAVVFLVLALVSVGLMARSGPGPGEVSAILHGVPLFISLALAAVFAVVALWCWYWHIWWVRLVGFICILGVTLYIVYLVIP